MRNILILASILTLSACDPNQAQEIQASQNAQAQGASINSKPKQMAEPCVPREVDIGTGLVPLVCEFHNDVMADYPNWPASPTLSAFVECNIEKSVVPADQQAAKVLAQKYLQEYGTFTHEDPTDGTSNQVPYVQADWSFSDSIYIDIHKEGNWGPIAYCE